MGPRQDSDDEDRTPLSAELRALALRELAEIARRRPDAIDGKHFEAPETTLP